MYLLDKQMAQKQVSLIVACTSSGGIAYDNEIPWYIPKDMKKFKEITICKSPDKQNAVIMGRKTWESIGRRLPDRLNIVVTSDYDYYVKDENIVVVHSIMSAIYFCNQPHIENIFIIGGTSLYNTFLNSTGYLNMVECIYLTVLFYDNYSVNKFIDIDSIFQNFTLIKDIAYQKEARDRIFASYICLPNKHITNKHDTKKLQYR